MGNVVPSRRCPRTSRPMPMMCGYPSGGSAVARVPADRAQEHPDVLPNHGGGGIPKEALRRRSTRRRALPIVMISSTAVWRMA